MGDHLWSSVVLPLWSLQEHHDVRFDLPGTLEQFSWRVSPFSWSSDATLRRDRERPRQTLRNNKMKEIRRPEPARLSQNGTRKTTYVRTYVQHEEVKA
jgi:hypothetical protein